MTAEIQELIHFSRSSTQLHKLKFVLRPQIMAVFRAIQLGELVFDHKSWSFAELHNSTSQFFDHKSWPIAELHNSVS